MRDAYAPLVWQCRYSGIEVPDALWRYVEFGRGKKYSDNQAEHMEGEGVFAAFDAWTDRFRDHRRREGQGRARPLARLRLRAAEAPLGGPQAEVARDPDEHRPRAAGLVARRQQELGLNRDATLRPKKREGEKLREE